MKKQEQCANYVEMPQNKQRWENAKIKTKITTILMPSKITVVQRENSVHKSIKNNPTHPATRTNTQHLSTTDGHLLKNSMHTHQVLAHNTERESESNKTLCTVFVWPALVIPSRIQVALLMTADSKNGCKYPRYK